MPYLHIYWHHIHSVVSGVFEISYAEYRLSAHSFEHNIVKGFIFNHFNCKVLWKTTIET